MKHIKLFEQFLNENSPKIDPALLQFQKDEEREGIKTSIFLATFDGKPFTAQQTKKTWDKFGGVPVTKYFTRGGYKPVSGITGQHYVLATNRGSTPSWDRGWYYFKVGKTWYAISRGYPPPFTPSFNF